MMMQCGYSFLRKFYSFLSITVFDMISGLNGLHIGLIKYYCSNKTGLTFVIVMTLKVISTSPPTGLECALLGF